MKHIILMADIVGSGTKAAAPLMDHFKKSVALANQTFKTQIISPLTITLGDEFQALVNNVRTALEIIFFLEELKIELQLDFQLRYVVHQGDIETEINTHDAYQMLGPGLTHARALLTDLKKQKTRFLFDLSNERQSKILNNSFVLFDSISQKWNPSTDYPLVAAFLKLQDYKIVAETLNKTRSQIWKRQKSLNLDGYQAIKNIVYLVSVN